MTQPVFRNRETAEEFTTPSCLRKAHLGVLKWAVCCMAIAMMFAPLTAGAAAAEQPLTIVVMDPLALPLACDCVKGYAQRNYDLLGEFLGKRLQRKVKVVFAEDLAKALRRTDRRADLIIGKNSLVKFDAAECKMPIRPLAMLTGQDGKTTLTGLFVVPTSDPAQRLADLKGYRILFGPEASAEKHAAARAALQKADVAVPAEIEVCDSCNEAAMEALESKAVPGTAAVISSYAMALLEGCGIVDKGSLRVIGETEPLPFVTVFVAESVAPDVRDSILEALLAVRDQSALLEAMESKQGFVKIEPGKPPRPKAADSSAAEWPQWRGSRRDAVSPWLPDSLPAAAKIIWTKDMTGAGLSGIAATSQYVIVADRDPADQDDIFRCLSAEDGRQLWQLQYPAPGDLDYGNSPRATPLIHDGRVYLLGAFGDLHCVTLADGKVLWQKGLITEFGSKLVTWGMCASPLLADDKLIVNPGAVEASLVALDPLTGNVVWACPGAPAAYSSFIVGRFGPRRQIVGYDAVSLGGWDLSTGKRLWTLLPPQEGDFNVPTPIEVDGRLLVSTENNGTRLYQFDDQGVIVPQPVASNADLAPDCTTPVVVNGKVYGCCGELFCLDLGHSLDTLWTGQDAAFEDYVSIVGNGSRLLITSAKGELLLARATAGRYDLISRLRLFGEDSEVLSHPAIVGHRLFIRDGSSVCCVSLDPD
jgi:outer membrane protein assembly factor BamB